MALADIQEKQSDERKREKRLVHVTNALSRDFQESKAVKSKAAAYKASAEYIVKSFLDYVFFHEHKEIREMTDEHVNHFMLEFAPRKLSFSTGDVKKVPEILAQFLMFLETDGHIHNGVQLGDVAKANSRAFTKAMPKQKRAAAKKTAKPAKEVAPKKKSKKKAVLEVKVGRNDPCPCGSGKKYKKCCGASS
jgi:preprotein translocase subunit SecA